MCICMCVCRCSLSVCPSFRPGESEDMNCVLTSDAHVPLSVLPRGRHHVDAHSLTGSFALTMVMMMCASSTEAHESFLKRNLNNTQRKSAALTNYVAPLDYQTGISETMRRFKKELRDGGQDAASVSATIRDPSRFRDYSYSGTVTRDRPSPGARTTQTQRKRQQKVSKEDLEALRMLDLVHM